MMMRMMRMMKTTTNSRPLLAMVLFTLRSHGLGSPPLFFLSLRAKCLERTVDYFYCNFFLVVIYRIAWDGTWHIQDYGFYGFSITSWEMGMYSNGASIRENKDKGNTDEPLERPDGRLLKERIPEKGNCTSRISTSSLQTSAFNTCNMAGYIAWLQRWQSKCVNGLYY